MRYALIREQDIANGPGIRVSLYVQGCHRHCPGCFNSETWDFNGGKEYTQKEEDAIVALTNRDHIRGLSILGGEPMEEENQESILRLVERVRKECPKRTIWLYTSFHYEDIIDNPILDYIDVLVDGEFIESLKSPKLFFKGSSNQRTINVPASKLKGSIVLAHK